MLKFKSRKEYEIASHKGETDFECVVYDDEPVYDEDWETSFGRRVGFGDYMVNSWETALYRFERDVKDDELLAGWSEVVGNCCRAAGHDGRMVPFEGNCGDFYKGLHFLICYECGRWYVQYEVFTHEKEEEPEEESESAEGIGIDWFDIILSYFED